MNRRQVLRLLGGMLAALPVAPVVASSLVAGIRRERIVLDARIAGFAYYDGEECLDQLRDGDALSLLREPDNAHDGRAIQVFWQGRKMGYVPRLHNRALSRLMDEGEFLRAAIKRVDTDQGWEPLYFEVFLRD